MSDRDMIHTELETLFTEDVLWGIVLLALGIAGFIVLVFTPSASYLAAGVLFALSLAGIGAGIGRLSDAINIYKILRTMRQ